MATLTLKFCTHCNSWAATLVCPVCKHESEQRIVACIWSDAFAVDEDADDSIEGMLLYCPLCEWTGTVDERRPTNVDDKRTIFEVDG